MKDQINPQEDRKKKQNEKKEDQDLDQALAQMESIYRSRCVQPQGGSNVTIREIKKE